MHAAQWQLPRGTDALRNLISGATAEIELKPGVTATGVYSFNYRPRCTVLRRRLRIERGRP